MVVVVSKGWSKKMELTVLKTRSFWERNERVLGCLQEGQSGHSHGCEVGNLDLKMEGKFLMR